MIRSFLFKPLPTHLAHKCKIFMDRDISVAICFLCCEIVLHPSALPYNPAKITNTFWCLFPPCVVDSKYTIESSDSSFGDAASAVALPGGLLSNTMANVLVCMCVCISNVIYFQILYMLISPVISAKQTKRASKQPSRCAYLLIAALSVSTGKWMDRKFARSVWIISKNGFRH